MRLATYINEYFYNCLQIKNVYHDPRLKVETQRRFVRERGRSNSSKARFFFREHAALCSIIYFSLLLFLPLGNISSFLFSYFSFSPPIPLHSFSLIVPSNGSFMPPPPSFLVTFEAGFAIV